MTDTKKAKFTFYASENGRDGWKLVAKEDLPKWLLDPDVLGQLVIGKVAMKCDEGDKGSLHYRADVQLGAQDAAKLKKALRHRDRHEAENLLVQAPSKDAFLTSKVSDLKH